MKYLASRIYWYNEVFGIKIIELSILEVCLEEKDYVIIHGYLQDIVYSKEKKRYKVDQDFDQHTKLQNVPSGIMYLLVW